MQTQQTRAQYRFLGDCFMMPVNQIGESVRFDKKTKGFVLGRRGSIFKLHALLESKDQPLDDFRDTSCVNVFLECEGRLLVLDLPSGLASTVEMPVDVIPDDGRLLYIKRKFDGSSVSISSVAAPHLWLRHCNSRLMFHELGTGAQFNQDASFILSPIVSRSIISDTATDGCLGDSSANIESAPIEKVAILHNESNVVLPNPSLASLDDRISCALKKARLSNELLDSRLNRGGRDL